SWDAFWFSPLQKDNQRLQGSLQTLQQQATALEQSVQIMQARLARDPNAEVRARIARLQAEQEQLDGRLAGLRLALIPPREMPLLLRDIMAREPKLELIGLESQPVEVALRAPPEVDEQAAEALVDAPKAEGEPLVFRHPVELRFDGSFPQALAYVERLEALDWRFYWQALELETDPERGWPRTHVRLRLFTLSVEEGLIGG
ncbi:MAG: hypothetical protein D6717_12950, partial [Gammaproteobacteria bacterium]